MTTKFEQVRTNKFWACRAHASNIFAALSWSLENGEYTFYAYDNRGKSIVYLTIDRDHVKTAKAFINDVLHDHFENLIDKNIFVNTLFNSVEA